MSAWTRHPGPRTLATSPAGGSRHRLDEELVWRIGHVDGPAYAVPAGYVFELSVPLALRWLFNPHDARHHKAAALHDHMLEQGWSRITAGAEFHDALNASGVPAWRRFLMLLAVLVWRFE